MRKFRRLFYDSLDYLKGSNNYIAAIILIFLSSIFIGFAFHSSFSFLDEILRKLIDNVRGLNLQETILFIFSNNTRSAFLGLFLGFILGIFPIIASVSNGIVLGYVLRGVWINSGISDFWKILPHGIFELPAIFIALGLGIKLGMFVFSKEKKRELWLRLKYSLVIFVFIILPLLIMAAIIEGLLIFAYK